MSTVMTQYARFVRVGCAPWARREHAAATSCAPLERHGRCENVVLTLSGRCQWRCVHVVTDTFGILGTFRGDATAR